MDETYVLEERKKIVAQFIEYMPKLAPLFQLDTTLKDYSRTLYDFPVSEIQLSRQKLIKKIIDNKIKNLFGQNATEDLLLNLEDKLAINIADHHQIFNHPVLVSPNFISSVDKFFKAKKQEAILVISSGDVPPNNFFSKNGFQLNGKRVPIFSASEREYCSYYIPKRDFNFVARLKKAKRWEEFNLHEQKFLERECERIAALDFSRCKDYNDQISIIVKNTWALLFEDKLRATLPELIYVTQEEITSNALVELIGEDNMVSACLFDPEFRARVIEIFRGIVVTWQEREHKGTHFFWRKYPGEPRSVRMYIQGNRLVPDDVRFKDLSVELEKDTILEMLDKKEIYPSLFMIFAVLNFYAGIRPLVGHGSLMYLGLMKARWVEVLKGTRFGSDMQEVERVNTDGLIAGLAVFFKRSGEELKALYGYDIIYEGGIKADYLRQLFEMKLKDLMTVSVEDFYPYCSSKYIPKEKQLQMRFKTEDFAGLVFNWIK